MQLLLDNNFETCIIYTDINLSVSIVCILLVCCEDYPFKPSNPQETHTFEIYKRAYVTSMTTVTSAGFSLQGEMGEVVSQNCPNFSLFKDQGEVSSYRLYRTELL